MKEETLVYSSCGWGWVKNKRKAGGAAIEVVGDLGPCPCCDRKQV